jgi:hypothetical protein
VVVFFVRRIALSVGIAIGRAAFDGWNGSFNYFIEFSPVQPHASALRAIVYFNSASIGNYKKNFASWAFHTTDVCGSLVALLASTSVHQDHCTRVAHKTVREKAKNAKKAKRSNELASRKSHIKHQKMKQKKTRT